MTIRNVVVGFLPTILLTCGCGAAEWKEFSSKDGRYSVSMPGTPKETTQKVPTPAGEIVTNVATLEPSKGVGYAVSYNDMPFDDDKLKQPGVVDNVLDGSANGQVTNVKGKLISQKAIKLGEFPGREVHFEVPGQGEIRSRIFLVGKRLYQTMVQGPKASVTSKDADKFLDSFKVTK